MRELPANIWFVRSNGGKGSYPVKREGWLTVAGFALGMAASGGLFAFIGGLAGAAVFALGAAASATWFILTARRHTDFTLTYSDYIKEKTNA